MPEKLSKFLKDVASAKANGDAAEVDLIAKLKGLLPEDFARVPRDIVGSLSASQYADVVRSIAPNLKLNGAKMKAAPEDRYKRTFRDYLAWIPAPIVAMVVSIVIGMAILAAAISTTPALEWWSYSKSLSLPVYVAEWPRCLRLTRWTDGCVYRVTKGLPWRDAAGYLDVPESYLRHLNRHITDVSIPAGADLTVWRERFPLRESR